MRLRAQVGRRLTQVCMLSGSIVRVWGALESVLGRYEGVLSKSDRTMRVVRVDLGGAASLIGALSPKPNQTPAFETRPHHARRARRPRRRGLPHWCAQPQA